MRIVRNIFFGKNPFEDLEQLEKVLLVFEAAHRGDVEPINIGRIDPYLYIIQKNDILNFGYKFKGDHLPISGKLHEDIGGLLNLGYLVDKTLGEYYITDEVREFLSPHITGKSTKTLDQITDKLLEMEEWDNKRLRQECFVERNTPKASYWGPRPMLVLYGTIALGASITAFVLTYGICPIVNRGICLDIIKDATPENSLFFYTLTTGSFILGGYAFGHLNQKLVLPAEKRFMHWYYNKFKKPSLV